MVVISYSRGSSQIPISCFGRWIFFLPLYYLGSPMSVYLCIQMFSFIRIPVILDQGPPKVLYLNWIFSVKNCFQISSHCEVLGVRTSVYLWVHNSAHNICFCSSLLKMLFHLALTLPHSKCLPFLKIVPQHDLLWEAFHDLCPQDHHRYSQIWRDDMQLS